MNICFPVVGAVWGGLSGVASPDSTSHQEGALRFCTLTLLAVHLSSCSFHHACCLLPWLPSHGGLLSSWKHKPYKLLHKLLLAMVCYQSNRRGTNVSPFRRILTILLTEALLVSFKDSVPGRGQGHIWCEHLKG